MTKRAVFYLWMVLGGIFSGIAQSPEQPISYFEGSIEYKVSVEGADKAILFENEPNTQMAMHIKDGDYIVNLIGGRYPKTFMFIADSNFEYSIDMNNKRAFRVSIYNHFKPMWVRPPAIPNGETETINGVLCDVYEVKTDSSYTKIWASEKYRVNTDFYQNKKRAQANYLLPGLEGRIPIKTIKKEKGLTSTITMSKITPIKFRKEQFTIPPDFVIKNRDNRW